MTNEEMVSELKEVRRYLLDVLAIAMIDNVLAALKAEPEPLAVVEAYLPKEFLCAYPRQLAQYIDYGIPTEELIQSLVPITVTVTERKGE